MAIQTVAFIREVVSRLRDEIPVFQDRIGYAPEFMALRENYDEYELPYMFIVPVGSSPVVVHGGNTAYQRARYNFSTFICVDNTNREVTSDELTAHEQIEFIQSELWKALLGYNPDAAIQSDTIIWNGDFLHEMTHDKLWWQINWYVEHLIDKSNPGLINSDDYTIEEVFARGAINGLKPISSDASDYRIKNEDGCFEGDGVVNNDEATNPFEEDC